MLLAVLERGCFRRIGGTREIESDVRVIVATQADLRAAVRAGTFREDLYYRLAVLTLELPPLRERGAGEIARLAQDSVDEARRRAGARPAPITDAALRALAGYAWPGNVRELRNVLERAAVLARTADAVDVGHLPAEFRRESGTHLGATGPALGDDLSLRAAERAHILRVLALCGNNKVHAARALGITRATLYVRLQEYAAEAAGRQSAPGAAADRDRASA
jgi:DNA-binding NtrC family response regulator